MASVTITQGMLRGGEAISENGFKYYEFLSIPYAKPPVGELRFKSPQPPEPWVGERDATKSVMENISLQKSSLTGQITGSEDCLYLNVYTPKLPTTGSKLLPVLFYIHGGGFVYGNGIFKDEGNPELLIEKDIVVVSINYRVGVFGFLSLDIPEAAGNMGLKDQVKALEWVQQNIDIFGGDKNNVTIFGISAGGASVEYLMLSSTTKGLFHKAISNSGSGLNDWAIGYQYDQLVLNLADTLKYKGDKKDKRALYEFFLRVPAEELRDASFLGDEIFPNKSVLFGFVPIVEKIKHGAFITEHPYNILKEGSFAKVPVLRGFCSSEGSIMSMLKPLAINELTGSKNFVHYWSYDMDESDKENYNAKLRNAYLKSAKLEDDRDQFAIDFFGDLRFSAGIWLASIFFARHGIPEYVYRFSYNGNLNICKQMYGFNKKGAGHGDDFGYLLKTTLFTVKPDPADILLRSKIINLWTNFIKTGNPTPNGSANIGIKWPKFTETSKAYINFGKEITTEFNYEPEKMAILKKYMINI